MLCLLQLRGEAVNLILILLRELLELLQLLCHTLYVRFTRLQ